MSAFRMRETPDYQQITHTEQGRTLLPHALISIKVDDSRAKLTRSSSGEGLDRDEVVMRESRMGSKICFLQDGIHLETQLWLIKLELQVSLPVSSAALLIPFK
jgi:hypothetical protein